MRTAGDGFVYGTSDYSDQLGDVMLKRHSWHCQGATSLCSFTGVHCSISSLIAASISAMLEKMLVHMTLMTFPNSLRHTRALTNCLGPPNTSR